MAHMSLQNSQIRTNDGVNGGVRDPQHQDNTPESLKTEPDDHLLPILTNSGHNYTVQVSDFSTQNKCLQINMRKVFFGSLWPTK